MNSSYKQASQGLVGCLPPQVVTASPAIPTALEEQNKYLMSLHEIISELESRVQSVSRQEPSPVGEQKDSSPPAKTILERIKQSSRMIDMFTARLNNIVRLLDI